MSPPASILLVVEAADDAATVAELIDKVLLGHEGSADWLDEGTLDSQRAFVPLDSTSANGIAHTTWKTLKKTGPRVLGFKAQHPYAAAARRAIQAARLAPSVRMSLCWWSTWIRSPIGSKVFEKLAPPSRLR